MGSVYGFVFSSFLKKNYLVRKKTNRPAEQKAHWNRMAVAQIPSSASATCSTDIYDYRDNKAVVRDL